MTAAPVAPPVPPSADLQAAEQARRAVSLIFWLNGVLLATWAVNIPGIRDKLHLSSTELGGALLCVGIGSLLSMTPTGGWLARWGSQRVTGIAVVLCMLSLVLPFLMPNLIWLGLVLAVLGAANGVLDVSMNAQGVTVEKALARPVMSRLHAYFSLGSVAGAALGTVLVGRVPMLAHVGLVVVISTLLSLWARRHLIADPQPAPNMPEAPNSGGHFSLTPAVALLGGLCFLGMLSEGAHYDWVTLYYHDILGMTGGNTGVGYTAFVGCMTLGRWFGDRLRIRLGDEMMVRGGAALTVLGLGLALLIHQPVVATLGFAVAGLGLSNVVPVMYGTAGHALAGRGIAQVATIGYGGFLLGPPIIGFVAQHIGLPGALSIAWVAAALVALLGGLAFHLVRGQAATSDTDCA